MEKIGRCRIFVVDPVMNVAHRLRRCLNSLNDGTNCVVGPDLALDPEFVARYQERTGTRLERRVEAG